MLDDGREDEAPTRREYVRYAGGVGGDELLAGCASGGGVEISPGSTGATARTETSPTGTEAATETANSADGTHSVTMAPMGDVEFDEVPQDVFTTPDHHADVLLALGRGDAINAMHAPVPYGTATSTRRARADRDRDSTASSWR
jgi:hypothetical protein